MKRSTHNGQFQQGGAQLFQELIGICLKQFKAYVGVGLMERGGPERQQAASHGGNHTQTQRPGQTAVIVQQLPAGCFRKLQHGYGSFIEQLPGLRQLYFSGTAFKKDAAELVLQLFHLGTQRRLRQIQFPGGTGDGTFLYHGYKM